MRQCLLGRIESIHVIFYLRADCTKLKQIDYQIDLISQIDCKFRMLLRLGVNRFRSEIKRGLAAQKGIDIVDDGLDIVCRASQFPNTLVDCGLVMKGSDDEGPINGSAAAGCILQNFLRFLKVDHCLIKLLQGNTGTALGVKMINFVIEFF